MEVDVSGDRAAVVIALVVTAVWVASCVADAVVAAYDPPATVHALMMAVAGWAFGQRYFGRPNDQEDPDDDPPRPARTRRRG